VVKSLVQQKGYDKIVAAASGFGKDVVPRVGGLLDLQAITDVIEIVENGAKFKRPVYAGNAIATVSTVDKIKLISIRATNFKK
jgi:electron transfer flavoprotein alpha subunit